MPSPLLVDLELLGKAGETSTKGGALHGVYAIGDCATISKRSMLEHMDAMWAAADTDKNGVLNHDELNTMLSLLAHDFPQVGDGRMPRRHTWRCPPPPSTRGAAPPSPVHREGYSRSLVSDACVQLCNTGLQSGVQGEAND